MFTIAQVGQPRVSNVRAQTPQGVLSHLERLGVDQDDCIAVAMALHRPQITDVTLKHGDKQLTVSRGTPALR